MGRRREIALALRSTDQLPSYMECPVDEIKVFLTVLGRFTMRFTMRAPLATSRAVLPGRAIRDNSMVSTTIPGADCVHIAEGEPNGTRTIFGTCAPRRRRAYPAAAGKPMRSLSPASSRKTVPEGWRSSKTMNPMSRKCRTRSSASLSVFSTAVLRPAFPAFLLVSHTMVQRSLAPSSRAER